MRRAALLLAIALASSAVLAGCLGGGADKGSEPVKKAGASKPNVTPPTETSTPKSAEEVNETLGKRWHFHNYWGLSPNISLFDGEVSLGATDPTISVVPARVTVGSATFGLPQGSIVPPETGTVTVRLHYNASPLLGPIDVYYKPGNVAEFIPAGRATAGSEVKIPVSADMTDVPHRGRSVWQFRLVAGADEQGAGVANGTVHAVVVATIGRPIFIDPPHLDHWAGADTVPLVGEEREVSVAKAPVAGSPYVGVDVSDVGGASEFVAEFPVVGGRVVPEGAQVVLVRLTWAATAPTDSVFLPGLAFAEENSGTAEAVQPASDKPGERLYRISVLPRQVDSPYANQSTWTFRVLLDGDQSVFSGKVRVDAWASRLGAEAAPFPDAPVEAVGAGHVTFPEGIRGAPATALAQAPIESLNVGRK